MHHSGVQHALRLGVVLAFCALALGTCGAPEEAKPRPLPEETRKLNPGTYRSEEFEPSLSFRVGKGWTNDPPEGSDALLISHGENVGLGFVSAQEVYEPSRAGIPMVVEAPKDMVGWFQQHPYLQTSEPEPVTVGGVKGVKFDIVVENLPEDYSGPCAGECVDILRSSAVGWIAFLEDNKQRVIVLEDVKGMTVTMGFTIPATEFDGYAPEAQKVLDTVRWRGG